MIANMYPYKYIYILVIIIIIICESDSKFNVQLGLIVGILSTIQYKIL